MNYSETIQYLFQKLPIYQRSGKMAYKKDIDDVENIKIAVDAKAYDIKLVSADTIRKKHRENNKPQQSMGIDRQIVSSQLTGLVINVVKSVGDQVEKGDLLLVLESMKMENEIHSPRQGCVGDIVAEGDRVKAGDMLVRFQEDDS